MQFFVNGALFASFIPRLPEIRDRVGISVTEIGVLLSIAGLSGLVGSAFVGSAIGRFGTRRVMIGAGTVVSCSLAVIGLATTPAILVIGLVGMLTFDVLVDVTMNMQGSWLSARRRTPVINRLHGLWSLGTLIGGAVSSQLAALGVPLSAHLVVAGAVLLGVLGYVGPGLLRIDEVHEPTVRSDGHVDVATPLVLFGLAAYFAVAMEGSSIDWAAFRVGDDFGTSAGFAALGYVAVTGGMTVARFGGDTASVWIGERRLRTVSLTLAAIGLSLATLVDSRFVALFGFLVAGLGIATLLPTLYDTAARRPGRPGAGLGALTAGLRTATVTVPLVVGTLAGSGLSVGSAIALVTLPSVAGFALVATRIPTARGT